MILYGASGHAKVIISCLKAAQQTVLAVFDDDPQKTQLWDIPVVGAYDAQMFAEQQLVIAIGYNHIRKHIASKVKHTFGKVAHPSALVEASAKVGDGTVVLHQSIIQADCRVGRHVIVNTGASVDHDCLIEDFVHIAPHATLCGNVRVGAGTLIGAGAVVAPNLSIGQNCLIAAGSIITKNIPDNAIVRGNPGRIIKRG